MKIEIKLKDPKSCRGCACLMSSVAEEWCNYDCVTIPDNLNRPERCIDENGE